MDVRKVQDMRKNVEHQYITEDSKTRIYLSVVREFNEKEYEEYSKKKKRAKRRESPVSARTMISRNAQIRNGTIELPHVLENSVPGVVTPVKQIRPRTNRLGQPISTRIHIYRVPKKQPSTPIPDLVMGSGAGRMTWKKRYIPTNTAASTHDARFLAGAVEAIVAPPFLYINRYYLVLVCAYLMMPPRNC